MRTGNGQVDTKTTSYVKKRINKNGGSRLRTTIWFDNVNCYFFVLSAAESAFFSKSNETELMQ